VKRFVTAILLGAGLVVGAAAFADLQQQGVEAVPAPAQQQVQALSPQVEQQVQGVETAGVQEVGEGTTSPSGQKANAAAKVVVGVMAAAISLGATAASLMFL
jgi:hypothetical protein